jgi:hypothetical protein
MIAFAGESRRFWKLPTDGNYKSRLDLGAENDGTCARMQSVSLPVGDLQTLCQGPQSTKLHADFGISQSICVSVPGGMLESVGHPNP